MKSSLDQLFLDEEKNDTNTMISSLKGSMNGNNVRMNFADLILNRQPSENDALMLKSLK